MNRARTFPGALLFALVCVCTYVGVSQRVFASRFPEPPLNPKTYRSPSGEFSLCVNPSDRQGRGSAEYRLLKGSRQVWRGELPFTLRDVRVLDDGTAAGYGYTLGPEGHGGVSRDDYGDFIIAILDPQGELRLKEAVRRGYGRSVFEDQYPQPEALGLVVDAENDRLIVVVADPDINRQNTAWQQYRLSTGESLGTIHPKEKMSGSERLRWCHLPRPIPGTPLTVVQWYRSQWQPHLKGTHFAVVDLAGTPIWQRTLPDDYSAIDDEESEERLWNWFRKNSAILSVQAARRFDLYFAKKGQRVSFLVQRSEAGQWTVREIDREDYELPEEPATDQAASGGEEEIPRISLDYLGTVELRAGASKSEWPFSEYDLRGFTITEQGRSAFIRTAADETRDLVLIDQQGVMVRCVPLPALNSEQEHWGGHAWLGGDRFIVAKSQYGAGGKSQAWIVDFASGELTPLPNFECPSVEAIIGLPNAAFAVLATHRYKYTMASELRAYDAKGRLQWKVGEGQLEDREALFSPEDICLTADGLIAVVETIGEKVKFYDQSGQFIRLIDLAQAWGRAPRYPAEIEAMPDGGLIVADAVFSNGLFVRMAPNGDIHSQFSLRFPDGRRLVSSLVVGPDGRMWTAHGRALLEINGKGVVKHVVGEAPTAERLDRIAAATMDHQGRLYVLDQHTYCVHLFSPEGERVLVCKPDPRDVPADAVGFPNITISDAGETFVSREDGGGYIRFSPEGHRLGIARLGLDSITEQWHFQPGSGCKWVRCYKKIVLVDPRNRVIKTVERRPDGHWLENPGALAVAPDGSIVVFDAPFFGSDSKPSFCVYSADGEPVRAFPAPAVLGRFAEIAYGDKLIAAIAYEGPLFLFDALGKPLLEFEVGKKLTPKRQRYLLFPPGGKELHVLDAETHIVHRFALPKAG